MAPLAPLIVTTSDRADRARDELARRAAEDVGVPFLSRSHSLTLERILREQAQTAAVFELDAVALVDPEGTLRFSAGVARLRIKQLDAGVQEDMLLRISQLQPGESVLDCTLGLAGDTQVAARLVGPEGRVTALEKSTALYLLVKYGLAELPGHPRACRPEVLHADAHRFLQEQPSGAFDVVLFDPMFERRSRANAAFDALRRHADYAELTRATLQEARRVARRAVVIKGSRYSQDFKKLGVQPHAPRRNATIVWAQLPPL